MELHKVELRIKSFISKCPNCGHKQHSYTQECEECRFSWLRYYNQLQGIPLDTPYETKGAPSHD